MFICIPAIHEGEDDHGQGPGGDSELRIAT